jgi:hypothetical protein
VVTVTVVKYVDDDDDDHTFQAYVDETALEKHGRNCHGSCLAH